ncbi:hypothetical protein BDZ90DRAFT_230110 [Jaminaea rosea]|uniref:Uncharacterized protein n=1 Tax=Jaminaea rosea TaxID=1569628 RepID=A0A316V4F6_9BASI|nr:hypothetical protein BDZ90DRAFT_230110 [Jaminaea rosea]PWN31113.1 hypothetical protein BDZ90DRAFT_230110 [Jaminaea rosea]
MSKAGGAAEEVPVASTSAAAIQRPKESRKLPFQYAGFYPPPPLNTKYVSSSFLKTDLQSVAGRMLANGTRTGGASSGKNKRKAEAYDDDEDGSGQEDEEEDQQTPASQTIIIHPGSTRIRVGLATDVAPVEWPCILARRPRLGAPPITAPTPAEPAAEDKTEARDADGNVEMKEGGETAESSQGEGGSKDPLDSRIGLLRNELKSIMRFMKLRGVSNGRGLAAQYNLNAKAESIPSHNDLGDEWTPEKGNDATEVELGERALKIPSLSPPPGSAPPTSTRPWKLFSPFKAGKLNHAAYIEAYGTTAERRLSADIAHLFSSMLTSPREDLAAPGKVEEGRGHTLNGLGIAKQDLASHSIILIVPDLFPKDDLRLLAEVIMDDLGVSQLILQQESTAATFGAGMSSACVVHVGGERTSIACVDDGLLLQDTRMHLDFGGEDITAFLYELLKRANLAYRECDPRVRLSDVKILEDLKRQMITLDAAQIGLYIYNFFLRLPNAPTKKFEVRVYDEAILAPMLLFGLGTRLVDFARKEEGRRAEAHLTKLIVDAEEEDEPPSVAAPTGAAYASDKRMPVTAAMLQAVRHLFPQVGGVATTAEDEKAAATQPAEENSVAPSRDASVAPGMAAAPSDQGSAAAPKPIIKPPPTTTTTSSLIATSGTSTFGAVERAPPGFDPFPPSTQLPLEVALYHSLVLSGNPIAQGPFPQAPTAGQMASATAQGEERVRRLASNILVVGGSARIAGMGGAIEGRVTPTFEREYAARNQKAQREYAEAQQRVVEQQQRAAAEDVLKAAAAVGGEGDAAPVAAAKLPATPIPVPTNLVPPPISVIPPPRDLDPTLLAWKGMAVLARLDSAADMWTTQGEWALLGWKAVRDKCVFL